VGVGAGRDGRDDEISSGRGDASTDGGVLAGGVTNSVDGTEEAFCPPVGLSCVTTEAVASVSLSPLADDGSKGASPSPSVEVGATAEEDGDPFPFRLFLFAVGLGSEGAFRGESYSL